ncbi:MAG: PBSX family phage terminase large subunit, partial [Eubacteriales bacterium]|nr:PBSX family phage terminase large subunit [Eubacteriales bacterium]
EKQREYRRNATRVWNVKTGATRSGKTYGDYFLLPKRLLDGRGREGINVVLGSTRGTLQRNIILPMQAIYGPKLVGDIRQDGTAVIFGEPCHCLGADSVRQVNRLRGASVKYCYGDEVTTWHPAMFEMLKSRLDKAYSLFDGTCNPEGPTHWFKKFLDQGGESLYQQAYTLDDNPFNPPEVVARMKRDYAGTVYYDRYIRGLWVAAEGAVYRLYADDPERFIIGESELAQNPPVTAAIGVDFGGNGSGHAFSCTGFTHGFRGMVSLAEWYHKGEITPDRLEAAFVDFARDCLTRFRAHAAYCDSAEPTLILGLRAACARERLPIEIRKARKGPINGRIRFLCRQMAGGRYHILRRCEHTREALLTALWDARHQTEDVRLDDGTTNIDSLDALEYSFEPYMQEMMGR